MHLIQSILLHIFPDQTFGKEGRLDQDWNLEFVFMVFAFFFSSASLWSGIGSFWYRERFNQVSKLRSLLFFCCQIIGCWFTKKGRNLSAVEVNHFWRLDLRSHCSTRTIRSARTRFRSSTTTPLFRLFVHSNPSSTFQITLISNYSFFQFHQNHAERH